MKPLNLLALLVFLGAFIYILTLSETTVRKIQTTYYRLISGPIKTGSSIETYARKFLAEVEHSQRLEKRLAGIEKDYGRLQAIEGRFRELERESAELRKALNFKKNTDFGVVTARIVRRKPSTWWQTAQIDRGAEKGILTHMPVLSYGGLVGKINQASPGISTIILLTDEACQVSAHVENTPEVGIVVGQRAEYGHPPRLRLRYLSKNPAIKKGMKVYTTGLGGLFPPNVLIGEILSIKKNFYNSEALIVPSVNFDDINTVFIITGKKT